MIIEKTKRPFSFWVIISTLFLSLFLLLLGQSSAIFHYEFAVDIGFQEEAAQVSEFGVAVNRAFGVGDTLIYIPLIILSIIGLILRKKWALITTAAVCGISAYWTSTSAFMFWFLEGVPGYSFVPGAEYWVFIGLYLVLGLWGIGYLILRGDRLLH